MNINSVKNYKIKRELEDKIRVQEEIILNIFNYNIKKVMFVYILSKYNNTFP